MIADPKSGPHRVGDDWQGYFFCGQEALHVARTLDSMATAIKLGMAGEQAAKVLNELAERLKSVREAERPRDAA